ncbi:MAG: Bug family tripartite tricarboxylate transporter substrate binding protein [Rhodospirillaceae bacterium]
MRVVSLCSALAVAMLGGAIPDGRCADTGPYPTRPIRFIVPLAPGGSVDIAARSLAVELSSSLGHQVVVDNRSGGGGNIGAELAARAAPDGYTMVMGSSSNFAVNPSLYRNLPFDPIRDFEPVSLVSLAPNTLVVHPALPAQNVKELVALAKAKPGTLNFASSGTGGSPHLAGELFKMVTQTDITHIPYKGTGQALGDLVAGQVQMSFGTVLALLPHIKAGKLRSLAVTVRKRVAALPDVPTMAESGYPAVETTAWNGVLVPAKTPRFVIQRLNIDIVRILSTPDVRQRFEAQGAEAAPTTAAEFGRFIRHEIDKWRTVVKAAGLKAN